MRVTVQSGRMLPSLDIWWTPKGRRWCQDNAEKLEVVKVQVPIVASPGSDMALVYNEDRTFFRYAPIDFEYGLRSMKGQLKAFFLAEHRGENVLWLRTMVKDPGW